MAIYNMSFVLSILGGNFPSISMAFESWCLLFEFEFETAIYFNKFIYRMMIWTYRLVILVLFNTKRQRNTAMHVLDFQRP